ncbi:GNAT family N-acetyltransferase [Mucilaginibacter sp. L3T2-6]|nr:GNAT family N-acetyltransferase [Mucilaginibacter sp. L3T2-6]MDV6213237.1 GNAT family N-acetyltransferase [Mucilaginibacter sp. L3T2-6]
MFFIESERLKMQPLTHQQLQILHNSGRHALEESLGLTLSNWQVDEFYQKEIDDAMINFWLPKTLANPDQFIWYTDWEIILKAENLAIGGMGFNGEPNDLGEAEAGYMIEEGHQGKGYATEALKLMSHWALGKEGINSVIVHTYESNLPSVRILEKCCFKQFKRTDEGLLSFRLNNDQYR